MNDSRTLVVIGLGQIGGSIALATRGCFCSIVGVDTNPDVLNWAVANGIIDRACPIDEAIGVADVVVLSVPVGAIVGLLPFVLEEVKLGTVVFDVGSTKQQVCELVHNSPHRNRYVALHPMAGTSDSGIKSASANLFRGARTFICQPELSSEQGLADVQGLFAHMGSTVELITPAEHDRSVAMVSHLPQVVSYAMCSAVEQMSGTSEGWLSVAASGFDSTSRLAKSPKSMWLPIFGQNKENLLDGINSTIHELQQMSQGIALDDKAQIAGVISRATSVREKFEHNKQTNIKMEEESFKGDEVDQVNRRPMLIAGPCSAESQEQLMEVAQRLKATNAVSFLRAGVWKPRTSPGSFEGYGRRALEWLRDVKSSTKMPFATEVGCGKHAYEALKYGADMLWIGARTVSNPFAMQEIADTLAGVDVPVFVKNPLSADLDLWDGAIKRLLMAGVNNVGAIHRGFSLWGKSVFRNQPLWEIPQQLKLRYPNMPIICDPSHITGNNALVAQVAQRALNLHFDGLMVEVHPNPAVALSDAKQQLTPDEFEAMLEQVIHSCKTGSLLNELRAEIDILDDVLIRALANRMELAGSIASVKSDENIDVVQVDRWNQVVSKVVGRGRELGLDEHFMKQLFEQIHSQSVSVQNNQISLAVK